MKQEKLDWLADNPLYTKRFAFYVGRRCRGARSGRSPRTCAWTGIRSRSWTSSTCASNSAGPGRPARGSSASTRSPSARAQLPHRGQRPGPGPADLVRRQGPLRGEPGRVLPLAGAPEMQGNPPGRHGHVEGVPQLHPQGGQRPAGRHPLRQVPHPEALGKAMDKVRRGSTPGSRGRTAGSSRARGTPCSPAGRTSPQEGRQALKAAVPGQQAVEHGLPAQGDRSANCGTTSGPAGRGGSSSNWRSP